MWLFLQDEIETADRLTQMNGIPYRYRIRMRQHCNRIVEVYNLIRFKYLYPYYSSGGLYIKYSKVQLKFLKVLTPEFKLEHYVPILQSLVTCNRRNYLNFFFHKNQVALLHTIHI